MFPKPILLMLETFAWCQKLLRFAQNFVPENLSKAHFQSVLASQRIYYCA